MSGSTLLDHVVPGRPLLGFWQIWNMGFGFLGIQFGFALQNANTSRIFQTLGAEPDELAAYWLAAPITGLIVQPLIGYYSDRTWHPKWGRRRPYFAFGALFASISLLMMPNSSTLWMAVGLLWIMDASFNVSMEPFRAFVGDKLAPSQRTRGFAMQSFFIGTGAIVGSFLPSILTEWFNVSNEGTQGIITDSVRYSFYIGAIALSLSVFWTVFSSSEYPPEDVEEQKRRHREKKRIPDEEKYKLKFFKVGILLITLGMILFALIYSNRWNKELYVLGFAFVLFGLTFLISYVCIMRDRAHLGLVHVTFDFSTMPKTMVQLAFVQFFSWFALFSMWIYTNPAVTSHIYHSEPGSDAYNEGANFIGKLFGGYNAVAAFSAFLIPVVARKTSRRITHLLALCCGGAGLISIYFIQDPDWLWASMVGVGIAWASILSMPYAMLAGSLPAEKMGYYMGVFNFFIVIPQIVAGSLLGFMLSYFFEGQSIYILVAGGVSLIVAGFLNLLVDDRD